MSLDQLSLTSITGVIAATFLFVEVLKRLFTKEAWFGKIPVFVYAIVIAEILTVLANRVLKLSDGTPVLPGTLTQAMWAALLGAASTGGFYTWLTSPSSVAAAQPLRVTNDTKTSPPADLPDKSALK